MYMLILVTTHL